MFVGCTCGQPYASVIPMVCPIHGHDYKTPAFQPRVYPDRAGKTEEVRLSPVIPSIGAVPPKSVPQRFPLQWDERDAKV